LEHIIPPAGEPRRLPLVDPGASPCVEPGVEEPVVDSGAGSSLAIVSSQLIERRLKAVLAASLDLLVPSPVVLTDVVCLSARGETRWRVPVDCCWANNGSVSLLFLDRA